MYDYELEVLSIVTAIEETNPEVREYARNVLQKVGYRKAIPTLRYIITDKKQPTSLRAWSSSALGQLQDTKALILLLGIFKDKNEKNEVRIGAATGITKLGKDSDIDVLISALYLEEKTFVLTLLDIISRIRNTYVFEAIEKFIIDSNDNEVILSAVIALIKFGPNIFYPFLKKLVKENQAKYSRDFIDTLNSLDH